MHGIKQTIERNICIGCGACAYATQGQIPIVLDKDGMYVADGTGLADNVFTLADAVCPFSDAAYNEDQIAQLVHYDQLKHHDFLGNYSKTYAGRVGSDEYLQGSSSGGLTSWLLSQLLERGVVDSVINVGHQEPTPPIFSYDVVGEEGVRDRRKSQYYSITLDEALGTVRETPGRYALVGVPCFIKAARLVAEEDPIIKERIVFHVGLVCGHMKSHFFGQSLAWQVGVEPENLADVDFRVKRPGRPASAYDFGAKAKDSGDWNYSPTRSLLGGNWGHGSFQPEACNFCDDIFAETADVAFGDAWLPEYVDDWRGTNVVVSRSDLVNDILEGAAEDGELELEETDPERVAQSQAGNFRHRRLGVSVRSADDIMQGLSVPKKRVPASTMGIDARRLRIIRARRHLSKVSFTAFRKAKEAGDLNLYLDAMKVEIDRYQKVYSPLWRRVAGRIKREIRSILPSKKPKN